LQTALRDIPKLSIQLVGDNVVLQGKDLTLEEKERVDGYAPL
jgi:pilus assembly protein CpaC